MFGSRISVEKKFYLIAPVGKKFYLIAPFDLVGINQNICYLLTCLILTIVTGI